jgi:hypothetical protein
MRGRPTLNLLGVAVVLGLLSFVLINGAHGQALANNQGNNNTASTSSSSQVYQPKLHLVKITSPNKGQQVPVGKDLFIYGTSEYNLTSDCKVSVIVNGVKPYQGAYPHGDRGGDDYSRWSFILTPEYTSIKQGQNKITAKFSCINNPNLISHNSVNVTGVAATGAVAASSNDNLTSPQNEISSTNSKFAFTSATTPTPTNTNPIPLPTRTIIIIEYYQVQSI